MGWLFRHNWLWSLLAFLLGAIITWFLLVRRDQSRARAEARARTKPEPTRQRASVLVGATAGTTGAAETGTTSCATPGGGTTPPAGGSATAAATTTTSPAGRDPGGPAQDGPDREQADRRGQASRAAGPFSRRMDPNQPAELSEATLFDLPPNTGDGSADTGGGPATADKAPAPADDGHTRADDGPATAKKAPAAGGAVPASDRGLSGNAAGPADTEAEEPGRAVDGVREQPADGAADEAGPVAGDVAGGVPPGRYGEGSADAQPHQGPPDGFTIKGNAQSKLFHTPDSPYYGRTKPEVWFRTDADAERAGFTKYVRRPRKTQRPGS